VIIDAIVARATRIFKPLLKLHKEKQKTGKRSLNSFEMSSFIIMAGNTRSDDMALDAFIWGHNPRRGVS
jgi:hypothetical protein